MYFPGSIKCRLPYLGVTTAAPLHCQIKIVRKTNCQCSLSSLQYNEGLSHLRTLTIQAVRSCKPFPRAAAPKSSHKVRVHFKKASCESGDLISVIAAIVREIIISGFITSQRQSRIEHEQDPSLRSETFSTTTGITSLHIHVSGETFNEDRVWTMHKSRSKMDLVKLMLLCFNPLVLSFTNAKTAPTGGFPSAFDSANDPTKAARSSIAHFFNFHDDAVMRK